MDKNLKKISVALFEAELNLKQGFAAFGEAERQFQAASQKLEEANRLYRDLSTLLGINQPIKDYRSAKTGLNGADESNDSVRFQLDGETGPINRLALRATTMLGEKLTFEEMIKKIPQETIMPRKGKLVMWVESDKVHEHTSEPRKRYFIDHPITTKDGKIILCTTQWAIKEYNKESGKYVDGTFKRFIRALEKEGIHITEVPKYSNH